VRGRQTTVGLSTTTFLAISVTTFSETIERRPVCTLQTKTQHESRDVAGKPQDAVVKFDTCQSLQRHRAVLPAIARFSCCCTRGVKWGRSRYRIVVYSNTENALNSHLILLDNLNESIEATPLSRNSYQKRARNRTAFYCKPIRCKYIS